MAPLSLSVLQAIFYKLGMEDDLSIFIRFRSVCSDFLSLAHQVGGPIKAGYHILSALSYYRLLPATTLLYYPGSVTATNKVREIHVSTGHKDLCIKANHLQRLNVLVTNTSTIKVELDVASVEDLELFGEKVFFSLTFPVKNLHLSCLCDVSLLNLVQTQSLVIKYYSGLTGTWPVFPCLKYLTEQTVNEAPLLSSNLPNLRRMILASCCNREIFPGELFLVHSLLSTHQSRKKDSCADVYLVKDLSKVPSVENVIYRVDKLEKEDIIPLDKASIRFFSNLEITPEVKTLVKTLCGKAKIFLRGETRVW